MRKPCLMRSILLSFLFVMLLASLAAAAENQGAIAATNARRQASAQVADNMGVSGPGSDLRRISRPRTPTTFTGLPAGVLPGDNLNGGGSEGGNGEPLLRTVMSGEPLAPAIGSEMAGSKLDRLLTIAAHLGYNLVRIGYSPTVIDTPYSYALMNGNRKVSTLYFDRSMALVTVQ